MDYLINILLGLIFSLIFGKILIPILKRLNAGQSIREDGPQSHLIKSGTPTIGGIIFLSSTLITTFLIKNLKVSVFMIIFSTFAFGAVGFIDDYIKVVKKRNLGLRAYQKLILQIIVAVVLIIYQYNSKNMVTDVYIPFLKDYRSFGIFYIPFIIFVIVGTVNSVNLTDGLDGLSSSVTIICLLFFVICANKLNKPEIAIFSMTLAASLLGFLVFNKYPAKVFMGDTGSLALGGAISAIALLLNVPLILPIAGGIYFIETLSVIIQVVSFKTRGKRVFLMAPLHHHYEQKGWHETKIVAVFCVIEIILCVISYLILF
ncbi:phospho-N-acetylmuramoyl-pentapeptide-transferase [Peptoniphilus rhinitidis]|uniref:phospho-N-acetylmuramoyl-pentapeptide- transferase n=2 Tax=Peptoniphilus rhinitidis TaxID=1175452 RepID=UPI0028FF6201|nr:phospho-N-acetylmuramoyl-pentapeptide-transferase [Peptoniphilus rhinitidis]MDU1043822.1 phospho-N-acetylmuramoyl-pentapeptide-transferase [Peptoniphilus rhinitidis]MDU2109709.1 phospho-N-acetylmuramoyl-pentapeptide-transferase [Peptoniphilus lacydonensis]